MAVSAYLPTLGTVVLTAAVDSVNPCAIGVLILLVSVILSSRKKVRHMLFLGSLYVGAVFMTYLLAGIGLTYTFASLPLWLTEYLSIAVGLLIVFAGLLEIKDYFWYGRWFSLTVPSFFSEKFRVYTRKITVPGIIFLGFFVAIVELPCTGAPYLAIITLLSQYFDFYAFILLVLYNVIFVAPLILMLVLIALGTELHHIKMWQQKSRAFARLLIGLILVGMGWLLILIANGMINLG